MAFGWKYPPLIINAALTGMIPTKDQNIHIPVSPEEIARDAKACFDAGARVVHVHARDKHQRPAWEKSYYEDIIGRIRQLCPQLVICITTSGRNFNEIDKRAAALELKGELRPDMASLTLGSLNFPKTASVNAPDVIKELATRMNDAGIKPELEVFETGMIDFAGFLIEHEYLKPPFYFNLFLGSLGSMSARPDRLQSMIAALPPRAIWGATGIGRFQHYVTMMALAMEGNVRIGLEDNIWYDYQRTTPATNPMLVARIANAAQALGRELATPEVTRELLGLPAS